MEILVDITIRVELQTSPIVMISLNGTVNNANRNPIIFFNNEKLIFNYNHFTFNTWLY